VIQDLHPAKHKVVRCRFAYLRAEMSRRWPVEVHVSTIGVWLGEMGLTLLQQRLVHPKKDTAAEATFKKNVADLMRLAPNGATTGTPIKFWFQDEAGVGK
jgi:hypothetical protein